MLGYTIQHANVQTKFYSKRYTFPRAKEGTDEVVQIPLPEFGDEDFGGEGIYPIITAIWQSLRIQGYTTPWNTLSDFSSDVVLEGKEPSIWHIQKALPGVHVLLFKKWQDTLLALLEGHPLLIGGATYGDFTSTLESGIVPMPPKNSDPTGGFISTIWKQDAKKDEYMGLSSSGKHTPPGTLLFRGSYLRNLLICRDFFTLTKGR